VELLEQMQREGWKRVNLTDPDAAYMRLGAGKKLGLGHSFEAAADQGLLVVGQRGEGVTDNQRLDPILAAARQREPHGITQVDADSGFYQGKPIGELLRQGVDVCIPDANTASDLHRGQPIGTTRDKRRGDWTFLQWDATAKLFRCQNGTSCDRSRSVSSTDKGGRCTVRRTPARIAPSRANAYSTRGRSIGPC
jgi:hypothetical protein